MAASTSAGPGGIFISYRREESAFPAGWLYDRLCAHLGSDYVFKDVDSIDPGDDFLRVIEDAVGSCQVLLALIGDRWLDITDGNGRRRLDDPNDFVRLEIEAALHRDVRVIPILVGRAPIPRSEQLPDSLRGLVRRQAIELSPNRFEPDVARLVRTIDKTLAAIGDGPADAPAPADRTTGWTVVGKRSLRIRNFVIIGGEAMHDVTYRLGSMREWLTVDGTVSVYNELPLGNTRQFQLVDGGRRLDCRLQLKLMLDNFAIMRAHLFIAGELVYTG